MTSTDLVRQLISSGETQRLISLFETLTEQRDRATLLNRSYLHEIRLLHQKFQFITEPASGQRVSEPKPRSAPAPSRTVKPTVEPMEL